MVDTVMTRVWSALAVLAAVIVAIALVSVAGAAAQPVAHADPPLAYRACPQDDCAIFVRDPDGSERRVTANDGDHGPAWSPDGREIAFVGQDVGLFAIGVDGAGERRLSGDVAAGPLSWSPDGRWVAFRRGEGGTGDPIELAIVPADGSEGRVLLDGMTGFGFAWAPDGQRLAAVLTTPGAEPDHLLIVNVDGEVERTIATAEPHLSDVAWSPDGTRLAYGASDLAGGRFSAWRAYVVAADGTGTRRVGGDDARPSRHSWSPDGTRLAVQRLVARSTTDLSFEVDVVDPATGSVLSEISFPGRTLFDPVWSANGDRLYLRARTDRLADEPAVGGDWLMVTGLQGEQARDLHAGGTGYAVGPAVSVCPQEAWWDVGQAAFSDRSVIPPAHRPNVDCAVHHAIVQGFADGTFRPALDVRRDQMASLISGTLEAAGVELPEAGDAGFTDVPDDSPHAEAIARLAAAGIVQGSPGDLPPDAYGPALPVRRDQMASFLIRAAEEATGEQWTSQTQGFDDVPPSNAHVASVNAAAERGLATGFSDGTFRPDAGVRRDQTASFTVRLLAALTE